MAFDCPEAGESLRNLFSNPWNEEILPKPIPSYSLQTDVTSELTKNNYKDSVGGRLAYEEVQQGGDLPVHNSETSENTIQCGHLTIQDLPSVLVFEILHRLDAKELGVISCVSTSLNKLASEHKGWKDFYCDRWGPPPLNSSFCLEPPNEGPWKKLFIEREFRSKAFMGRYTVVVLHGHTESVRSVFILLSAKLIFSGGYDSIVRMWDMEDGLCISSSRPLGCTIRAIAADNDLLVAGGTDSFLQCWRATEGHRHRFDISCYFCSPSSEFRLWGHDGPITCIALDSQRIFSGSWDTSIRIWDRTHLNCVKVLWHGDWVFALVPRGSTITSTAGKDTYVWDIETGNLSNIIRGAHLGNVYSLAQSYSGNLLFTGGEDGAIHMFDMSRLEHYGDIKPRATWIPHGGSVNSLAFEFPWLVSSSSDGRLALIDVRKLLKSNRHHLSFKKISSAPHSSCNDNIEPPQRMLHGFGCNLFAVDVGANRIVCGGEEGIVRVWDFTQALEIEKRVQASRKVRLQNRMRRRKVQIEMNSKGGQGDQCSVAAKRNQGNGDQTCLWQSKQGLAGKLEAWIQQFQALLGTFPRRAFFSLCGTITNFSKSKNSVAVGPFTEIGCSHDVFHVSIL